ncbi:hypothetical protein FOF71_07955 [Lactobacillus paragasseri]|jgi:hypothetical protein|uniref:Uncharacterized protein n=1 Tax=Lactobacillus paragasseri TaxID=2107999 RepID=A0AAW6XN62_9LACO|nr:hypothetical protein [Lactobacillus paragasseri]MDK6868982.1 hypothetical protein [Lactobacillus paragasseri]TVU99410.1 hypothetical protein FOF71_07955 [Lactobacillus paragasseri]
MAVEVMNKLKFLKSIYDKQNVTPKNSDIYDENNLEVQIVLQLNKEKLVDYNVKLKDNAQDYYMANYQITDKGKQYVDEHSTKKEIIEKSSSVAEKILIGVAIAVVGAIITYFLHLK